MVGAELPLAKPERFLGEGKRLLVAPLGAQLDSPVDRVQEFRRLGMRCQDARLTPTYDFDSSGARADLRAGWLWIRSAAEAASLQFARKLSGFGVRPSCGRIRGRRPPADRFALYQRLAARDHEVLAAKARERARARFRVAG